jgi:hypothetical protein
MFVVCFVDRTFVQNGFGGELEEWVVLRDDDGLYWFGRESEPLCNWIWRRIGGMGCLEG